MLDWIEDVAGHGSVLAITHGGTVDFLYRLGTGQPPHGGVEIHASRNASLSTFEINGAGVHLVDFDVALRG